VQNDAYRDKYNELFLGGKVKLFSISVDTPEELASWAKDRNYPHTFLSDAGGAVGTQYGAYKEQYKLDMRLLYVIGPDGKITYRANPFREVDPTAYTELGDALMKTGHAGMSHGGMTKGE
jgi:peroxiredoxin